ncbi:cytochrome b/b6 domain-containing protein [Dichotomicrobium thermohalophilum]|uniref:Cytochrome b n=1 Tax=Dichotomicrobium thermohalophilum TaxID=933063 RepID=A0A397Q724_9HYPH|nr:cytochrome b/b6 domain-containing protein [Dichotomicrobium thermohalophilum]RIA56279.1 cytochrome b [Dichotomicrobium thermohalophilum]
MVATEAGQEQGARGWDPLVRLTHWGVAAGVLLNGIITEGGSQIHVWIGYAAFSLLVLRLLWGFIGPEEARFSAFPPSLSAAAAHLKRVTRGEHRVYRSHNPLGGLMAYALWATLTVVALTGIAMAGSPLSEVRADEAATEYAEEGEYGEHKESQEEEAEWLEESHEFAANLLLFLAAIHVAGVGFESATSRVNLVRSMITGERRRVQNE